MTNWTMLSDESQINRIIQFTHPAMYNNGHNLKAQSLQAVEGKPPNKVIGRWGAVGQIHLICSLENKSKNQAKLPQ